MVLVKILVVTLLDYVKELPGNNLEKYAKAFYKFNNLYQSQKIKYIEIFTIFIHFIKLKT